MHRNVPVRGYRGRDVGAPIGYLAPVPWRRRKSRCSDADAPCHSRPTLTALGRHGYLAIRFIDAAIAVYGAAGHRASRGGQPYSNYSPLHLTAPGALEA